MTFIKLEAAKKRREDVVPTTAACLRYFITNKDEVRRVSRSTLDHLREIVYDEDDEDDENDRDPMLVIRSKKVIQLCTMRKLPLEIGRRIRVKWETKWEKGTVIEGEIGEDGEKEINIIHYDDGEIEQLDFDAVDYDWDVYDDWDYI